MKKENEIPMFLCGQGACLALDSGLDSDGRKEVRSILGSGRQAI